VRVEIGDFLEAGVEDGKIIFTPKSLVDSASGGRAGGCENGKNARALR